jgi:hypothetical protein
MVYDWISSKTCRRIEKNKGSEQSVPNSNHKKISFSSLSKLIHMHQAEAAETGINNKNTNINQNVDLPERVYPPEEQISQSHP